MRSLPDLDRGAVLGPGLDSGVRRNDEVRDTDKGSPADLDSGVRRNDEIDPVARAACSVGPERG